MRGHGRIGAPEGATDRSGGSAMPESRVRIPDQPLGPMTPPGAAAPQEDPSACTAGRRTRS
ncbi:MAG TPA: hypothetical protein DD420_24070 [Streptomyces sp.]|nr:hypothetical protein [Streptomyces sp.]